MSSANSANMPGPVLVTGGSGFVASHLVKQLLKMGLMVHATVRDLQARSKVEPLAAIAVDCPDRLHLFEADLLADESFDAAMEGCELVFHVASPFRMPEKIRDGQAEMVDPALNGTRNVLDSVNRCPSVRRVVLTSTIGAIFGDYIDVMSMENETLAERYFNETSTLANNPYHLSKVLAEKEAWKIADAQSRWDMVVICPGLVLGPSLTPASESGSLFLLDEMFRGYLFFGMPDISLACVDVRDVALAHINAAMTKEASGRYIVSESRMRSFADLAKLVRRDHPRPWLVPTWQIPNVMVRLVGPLFGLTQEYIRNHLGIRFQIDNSRSRSELGLEYRPIEETVCDHLRCWLEQRGQTSASATR